MTALFTLPHAARIDAEAHADSDSTRSGNKRHGFDTAANTQTDPPGSSTGPGVESGIDDCIADTIGGVA